MACNYSPKIPVDSAACDCCKECSSCDCKGQCTCTCKCSADCNCEKCKK